MEVWANAYFKQIDYRYHLKLALHLTALFSLSYCPLIFLCLSLYVSRSLFFFDSISLSLSLYQHTNTPTFFLFLSETQKEPEDSKTVALPLFISSMSVIITSSFHTSKGINFSTKSSNKLSRFIKQSFK